jgi:hypothetical protein
MLNGIVNMGSTELERGSMTSGPTDACPSCEAIGPFAWVAAMSLLIARPVDSGGCKDEQAPSATAATRHRPVIERRMMMPRRFVVTREQYRHGRAPPL